MDRGERLLGRVRRVASFRAPIISTLSVVVVALAVSLAIAVFAVIRVVLAPIAPVLAVAVALAGIVIIGGNTLAGIVIIVGSTLAGIVVGSVVCGRLLRELFPSDVEGVWEGGKDLL